MLRQRPGKAPQEETPAEDASPPDADGPAAPWHSHLTVRVILILLGLFAAMHLFLWKVVYDFAMDTNHDRLRTSWSQAMADLRSVRDHLYHLEFFD